jgi:hypothetical protein
MAQTAVEWFSNQTWKLKVRLENKEISIGEYGVTYVELFEQAKAMEKEQIMKAHGNKTSRTIEQGCDVYVTKTGEQYYNETYNK